MEMVLCLEMIKQIDPKEVLCAIGCTFSNFGNCARGGFLHARTPPAATEGTPRTPPPPTDSGRTHQTGCGVAVVVTVATAPECGMLLSCFWRSNGGLYSDRRLAWGGGAQGIGKQALTTSPDCVTFKQLTICSCSLLTHIDKQ